MKGKLILRQASDFVKVVKKNDKYMPLLLQSSDAGNEEIAKEIRVGFINKTPKHSRWNYVVLSENILPLAILNLKIRTHNRR